MKTTSTILLTLILLGLLLSCNSAEKKKSTTEIKKNEEAISNQKKAEQTFSSINLMNMKSNILSDSILVNCDGPLMIVFWGTTCGPCIKELKTFSSIYNKWQTAYDLKLIAVSTESLKPEIINQLIKKFNVNKDTILKKQNVRFQNFQKKHSFNFELYLDSNDELTNFLHSYDNIDTTYIKSGYFDGKSRIWIPQTIIIDQKGNLIKQKIDFKSGDEKEIEKILNEMKKTPYNNV